MALGFLGPISTVLMVTVMLTAIFTVHRGHGFFATNNGSELPIVYISAALAVAFAGPGQYSLHYTLGLDSVLPQGTVWIALGLAVLAALGSLALRRPIELSAKSS